MPLAARGLYIEMLAWAWEWGGLPDDPALIASLAGQPLDVVEELWPIVRPCFVERNGRLVNSKLEHVRENQVDYIRNRKNAGKRSARIKQARKKGTHTDFEWARMLVAVGEACPRCGREGVALVKDHVVPIYQGGSDSIDNIQPLCFSCNSAKGPETIDYIVNIRSTLVSTQGQPTSALASATATERPDQDHPSVTALDLRLGTERS